MGNRQASADPITAFVAAVEPDLVGHPRLRHRLAEEMRGHLQDASERYVARGVPTSEAQRKAIRDFGSPDLVVGAWAESKGVGVPTTFTRYAGLAGAVGALGLGTSGIYGSTSESYSHGAFAEVSLSFLALFAISLVALYMRVRGKLVPYARLGARAAIVGFVTIVVSGFFWFSIGSVAGFAALFIGVGTYLVGVMRSGVVPRGPVILFLSGICAALALGAVDRWILHMDGVAPPLVAVAAFAVGWAWLGAHLWNEKASDGELTARH